jgi:hypothetical protein
MPLHRVNPRFIIKVPFDGQFLVRIFARMIHIVKLVVVNDGLVEDGEDGSGGKDDHDGEFLMLNVEC